MDECIFCQMVAGEIPKKTVYEDEDTLAFLDINPLSRGHTLVIPKAHHERVQDMPPELAGAVFRTLRTVTDAAEEAVDADATTVAFNNGEAAGQEVPHVHGHVVPRFEGDGGRPIHAIAGDRPELSDEELDDVAAALRERT